jgi:glycosyltransferase 2 family protein
MVAFGVAVSIAILGGLIWRHVGELMAAAARIDWFYIWIALGMSLLSYAMIGMALWEILALLGFRLSFGAVMGIAFVSTTANYFVSSAGVSGFALKAHLLRKRHVPYGATVTASVLSTALMYFVLGVIIAQGIGYMILRMQGTLIPIMEGILGLGILLITSLPLLMFFFNRDLRGRVTRKIFHLINRVVYYFSKREIPREDFYRFEHQLNKGLDTIHHDKGRLTRAIVYTCLDWGCTMLTLYFGFRALGVKLSVGHLSTGFAVGQAATLIPILPGGMGAMEGSMAAVYNGFGIDWSDAMVASLIYRFAYYLIPGLLSVFLLWGLKVSEPALIEDTVKETLPEELKIIAQDLERRRKHPEQ